jgi:hypothetical protein
VNSRSLRNGTNVSVFGDRQVYLTSKPDISPLPFGAGVAEAVRCALVAAEGAFRAAGRGADAALLAGVAGRAYR